MLYLAVAGRQTAFVSEVTSDHWPVVAKVASGAAGNVSLGDCNPEGGEGGPLPGFDGATMEMRASSGGKYISLTCTINATSKAQLDALYRELSGHPLVKVVL